MSGLLAIIRSVEIRVQAIQLDDTQVVTIMSSSELPREMVWVK